MKKKSSSVILQLILKKKKYLNNTRFKSRRRLETFEMKRNVLPFSFKTFDETKGIPPKRTGIERPYSSVSLFIIYSSGSLGCK